MPPHPRFGPARRDARARARLDPTPSLRRPHPRLSPSPGSGRISFAELEDMVRNELLIRPKELPDQQLKRLWRARRGRLVFIARRRVWGVHAQGRGDELAHRPRRRLAAAGVRGARRGEALAAAGPGGRRRRSRPRAAPPTPSSGSRRRRGGSRRPSRSRGSSARRRRASAARRARAGTARDQGVLRGACGSDPPRSGGAEARHSGRAWSAAERPYKELGGGLQYEEAIPRRDGEPRTPRAAAGRPARCKRACGRTLSRGASAASPSSSSTARSSNSRGSKARPSSPASRCRGAAANALLDTVFQHPADAAVPDNLAHFCFCRCSSCTASPELSFCLTDSSGAELHGVSLQCLHALNPTRAAGRRGMRRRGRANWPVALCMLGGRPLLEGMRHVLRALFQREVHRLPSEKTVNLGARRLRRQRDAAS